MKEHHGCLQNSNWGCDSSTACQLSRRCTFADIFEQFELIEKVNGDVHEVVGVKCRLCDEVIIDEAEARELWAVGSLTAPKGTANSVMNGFAMMATPLLFNGGIHMLTCTRRKMN